MARVEVDFEEVDLEGDYTTIRSVRATCSRCDHEVESYGVSGPSRRRCLAMLRGECPRGETNFYVDPSGDAND